MIYDTIANAKRYEHVLPHLMEALEAAASYPAEPYETCRKELDGDKLVLLAVAYETRPLNEFSFMESHRRYADVMYMLEGEEVIYVKPVEKLSRVTQPYDAGKDALLAKVDKDRTAVHLQPGQFVVLLPEDAHCPGCSVSIPGQVKKIICKVAMDD